MSKYLINTTEISDSFKQNLKADDNRRIIFSGIFGIGKTTFLKNFFKNNDDYVALHLFPVNYSVAANEDIFELIKYDILYQILLHKPNLEAMEISKIKVLPYLDWNDTYKIIKPFIKAIPLINKSVPEILEATENLFKVLESKKKELSGEDQPKLISAFASGIKNKIGGIYERDLFTSLINTLIVQLKSEGTKQVVLIIDDVDRIDPEHIFRILNVFAAHFDSPEHELSENKFGVDKVILSCDVDNIKSIFHYKYGVEVDFNGYIDKFISKEVFYYDIRLLISHGLDDLLSSVKNEFVRTNRYVINFQIETFLTSMAISSTINLRNLFKYESKEYDFPDYNLQFPSDRIFANAVNLFRTFDFISSLTGGIKNTRQAFMSSNFVFAKTELRSWNSLLGDMIFIADHHKNKLSEGNYTYVLNGVQIQYEVKISIPIAVKIISVDEKAGQDLLKLIQGDRVVIDIKDLILRAFDEFAKYRKNAR